MSHNLKPTRCSSNLERLCSPSRPRTKVKKSDEKGVYYALDLGGTNFCVLRVELGGDGAGNIHQEFTEASIPPALMCGKSEVGQDVAVELTKAFERKGVEMRVAALVNDTIRTLAGGKYTNKDVVVVVILVL
ncbi:hypothetical protein ACS0TY_035278 [Phlomoides rotata]